MLSPHEFSTLKLISHASQTLDLGQAEIDVVVRRRLISVDLEKKRAILTPYGDRLLEMLSTWPYFERLV
jgi:hypothetical protein